ncbi:tubulin-specific chaperone A [Entomortierella parvispora]|uniref:Tubulin-specific chaperone A n=1 Tax=Entomortierella parvispora TaxID=205924 RepID=A0A9P3LZS3_9FUNG|nr:tubulin-specific chaperone A [Entomortierella parvispora]
MSTRDLSIKTNVLKRLAKEQIFYNGEKLNQQGRIDAMIAKDPEDYDIKKQREVLEETLDMLPDVERRKKAAHQDLANLVTNINPELKTSKEYEDAVQALEDYE